MLIPATAPEEMFEPFVLAVLFDDDGIVKFPDDDPFPMGV